MSISRKLHYFQDGLTVKTELHPSGEYSAIDDSNFDVGFPVGWGKSRFEAIADLADLMRERGLLEDSEPVDAAAIAADHAYALRKEAV